MKMSRRNVLAGLGGLAVGGGALLGSGAFSSVEASRDVQVNVTQDIANIEEAPDVLLNVAAHDEIAVIPDGGSVTTDVDNLSPSNNINIDNGNTTFFNSDSYVSLIENDVEIVFGHQANTSENRLPANSTVTFDNLIALVQEENDASQDSNPTDIAFGTDVGDTGFSEPPSVEIVPGSGPSMGQDSSVTNGSDYPRNVTVVHDGANVSGGSDTIYDVSVETGTTDEETNEEFGIAVSSSVYDLLTS